MLHFSSFHLFAPIPTPYAMRSIYFFKLFQIVFTCVLGYNLILFEISGKFVEPKLFLKSAAPAGHCHGFSIFEVLAPEEKSKCNNSFTGAELAATKNLFDKANATDDEKKYMDCVTLRLPTGDRYVQINSNFFTALKNTFYGIKTDLFDSTADLLAYVKNVKDYLLMFLVASITHCVELSVAASIFSTANAILAWLSFNWTARRWECTNFVPNPSPVLPSVLILSVVLLCSSLFELFFNHSLLHTDDDNRAKKAIASKRSANVKEVAVKDNAKNATASKRSANEKKADVNNDELSAVSVIKS